VTSFSSTSTTMVFTAADPVSMEFSGQSVSMEITSTPFTGELLLLESGDAILQETADFILLDAA